VTHRDVPWEKKIQKSLGRKGVYGGECLLKSEERNDSLKMSPHNFERKNKPSLGGAMVLLKDSLECLPERGGGG